MDVGISLASDKGVHRHRPTIHIEVSLEQDDEGKSKQTVIDFQRLAEEKYGKEATGGLVIPAPPQDMTADVEGDEDDDMEVLDAEGNVDISEKENNKPKKKNRGRVEGKYDLEDPFIDDSEMAWEEQAASTQDGFFVYLGPLQAEEPAKPEKPEHKKPGPPKGTKYGSRKSKQKDGKTGKPVNSSNTVADAALKASDQPIMILPKP